MSIPEIFRYWLQGGRIGVGFLGAAQIDRHANINTTVVGRYDRPQVKLPGAGGAPEIASCCREVFVVLPHSPRATHRTRLGLSTKGPTYVITDLCILQPEAETKELTLTSLHPGRGHRRRAPGHRLAGALRRGAGETPPPTAEELAVLRDLHRRTAEAHAGAEEPD